MLGATARERCHEGRRWAGVEQVGAQHHWRQLRFVGNKIAQETKNRNRIRTEPAQEDILKKTRRSRENGLQGRDHLKRLARSPAQVLLVWRRQACARWSPLFFSLFFYSSFLLLLLGFFVFLELQLPERSPVSASGSGRNAIGIIRISIGSHFSMHPPLSVSSRQLGS